MPAALGVTSGVLPGHLGIWFIMKPEVGSLPLGPDIRPGHVGKAPVGLPETFSSRYIPENLDEGPSLSINLPKYRKKEL